MKDSRGGALWHAAPLQFMQRPNFMPPDSSTARLRSWRGLLLMRKLRLMRFLVWWLAVLAQVAVNPAHAWDYEGHRLINQLALASLPTNFPAWVFEPQTTERIAFLAGEPDRWRNVADLSFRHAKDPDHYMDVEELADYGLKPESLPMFRGDFIAQLAVIRSASTRKSPYTNGARDQDHTRELVGLLPWAMAENTSRLKSGFSYLRAYEVFGGSPAEIDNARANVVYAMGMLGHFIGDCAQPLHTTIHHHGWKGKNPRQYTTNRNFHGWIDGGYFRKVGLPKLGAIKRRLRPAQSLMLNGRRARAQETFQVMMVFLLDQHKLTENLYQLEKEGRLSGNGEKGLEGGAFLENQMLKAAQMLGDCWLTAWQDAPPDTFLRGQLTKRKGK